MCGILAHFNSNNKINKKWLESDILSHRGGEGIKTLYQRNIGFSHSLLSLTGSFNLQPFQLDKNLFAINGEFYNYQEVQNNINSKVLKSDSELILDVYKTNNLLKFLQEGKLQGEFAGVIFDYDKDELILFRDHFGMKPLYYNIQENDIYISSEIKAFKNILKLNFDNNTIESVLSFQYHSVSDTLFDNIKQVPPASILTINLKTKKIKTVNYYSMLNSKQIKTTKEEAIKKIKNLVNNAVNKRFKNKLKNVGLTLSGGLDSSVIYTESFNNVTPYIIKFNNGGFYDESDIAKELTNKYNQKLNIISVTPKMLLDNFRQSVIVSEEVAMNPHIAAKYILFNKMKEDGIKISISGEGSDEVFLGYEHLQRELNNIKSNTYLEGIHSTQTEYLNENETIKIKNKFGFVPNFLNAKAKVGKEIINYSNNKSFNVDNIFNSLFFTKNKKNKVFSSSYLWSKICLSNYILIGLGDKIEMNSNISSRIPFLDFDLVNYLSKIDNILLQQYPEKEILREAYKKDLTNTVYKKTKHPFISPPLFSWSEEINKEVESIILNEISELNFINEKLVFKAKKENNLSESAFFILWSLAILYKEYVKS